MHVIFLLCCAHKKNTEEIKKKKRALHDSSVSASVYISVLLHVSKVTNCQSFAVGAILNRHPRFRYSAL